MSSKKQVLLLCGGGGSEHEISLLTAKFINDSLSDNPQIEVHQIEIGKDGIRRDQSGNSCELRKSGELITPDETIPLDFAIPCLHGYPGETGDIQSLFEMMDLPYLGSNPEASKLCFNKVSAKLWFDALKIPHTPYTFLSSMDDYQDAESIIKSWGGKAFIKASSQGSSVGCFPLESLDNAKDLISKAFNHSPYVLIEKSLKARELEVAVYQYEGSLHASYPGEITCPEGFYSYDEKYSSDSHTETLDKAPNLNEEIVSKIQKYSKKAFEGLKLNHLARIDFFLTENGEIYLNEINSFPGMTPISMFPKMMEANGHKFSQFLQNIILKEAR